MSTGNGLGSPSTNDPTTMIDEDVSSPPISVPESADTGEGGKLKMIVQLVKKCLGVKDIAAMRLSLPASLLEPIPNLEYWHYLDRPDIFASINDSDDPFERMLAVLRFTFTKDLKFIHGKVCKPYNSVLGEHFRAHWDVVPASGSSNPATYKIASNTYSMNHIPPSPTIPDYANTVSETASIKSGRSSKSTRSGLSFLSRTGNNLAAQMSNLSLSRTGTVIDGDVDGSGEGGDDGTTPRLRVIYVTEQVSHHPPVSAYFASCPSRHLQLTGVDQITAKVSGTTIRVAPGQYNRGIYVKVMGGPGEGETYHVTHPVAHVNGILRGSFYVTVGESTVISCFGFKGRKGFRAVIEYKEESWIGKPHFLVEGVVHTVFDGETQHEEWTRVKHVPHSRVVAVFDGSWRGRIRWRRVGTGSYPDSISSTSSSSPLPSHTHLPLPSSSAVSSQIDINVSLPSTSPSANINNEYVTLLDLSTLMMVPKAVRALERQLPDESRRLWEKVTRNLVEKRYGEATKEKVVIEQRQREDAAERRRKGVEFVPKYFECDYESNGAPTLTEDGWRAVKEELEEECGCSSSCRCLLVLRTE
ncbi:hypothetical protein AX17_004916 [Amanita inopinata Kibby_2008]|nr:hypothetical protein AX17_004916 [Amanita inopinata Kibby_2008]